jgi:hypothetical protein
MPRRIMFRRSGAPTRHPDELAMRAVAHRVGLQDPQIWRVLPKGRADILALVAADLQMRQAEACTSGLHGRGSKRILPGCSPSTSSRG